MKISLLLIVLSMSFSAPIFGQVATDQSRDITSVGFAVGSSVIGFDYEYRANDVLAIQGGVGIFGFDGAINLHLTKAIEGGYVSLAYKSIGFGFLNTVGSEYGHRWMVDEENEWGIVARI